MCVYACGYVSVHMSYESVYAYMCVICACVYASVCICMHVYVSMYM